MENEKQPGVSAGLQLPTGCQATGQIYTSPWIIVELDELKAHVAPKVYDYILAVKNK